MVYYRGIGERVPSASVPKFKPAASQRMST